MNRRATLIGTMAAALIFTAVETVPAYGRLASSARTVKHYLRDFDRSGKDLSPVERLVFSMLLAKSAPTDGAAGSCFPH